MVQKELYNVREHLRRGEKEEGREERLRSPIVLYSIESDRNSHPRTVSLSPQIRSPSSSVFLVSIQSSLTSTLTVVKLIET